jgi:isopentenyl diphosphate isomerase/L-lactate dehydrogenase-like FMN-dependent dehydrogenase
MQAEGGQLVCRIDEVADGDPVAWTLERLRQRLPAMLDLAGAHGLARAVETERVAIDQAAAQVAGLLRWAQEDATRRRNGATAS